MNFDEFMLSTEDDFDQLMEQSPTTRSSTGVSRRYIVDWQNPLEHLSAVEFKERYRFTKQGLHEFLNIVQDDFARPGKGQGLPALHKLLVFLRFASSGSFQLLAGDLESIKQPTVSKVVKEVAYVITSRIGQFVQWPRMPAEQCKENFFAIRGFPGVIGAIDCTHVRIQSPGGEDAERYRNRKGYFSINCQAVCNADLIFTNIYARWFGSTHDAKIFDNSQLCTYLESQSHIGGLLLGDQGYPLTPYLMTPLRNPTNQAEANYNRSHKKTRLTIERAFGVLKRMFSCLKTGLRLKVETTLNVIPACVILYNFMCMRQMIDMEEEVEEEENDDPAPRQHRQYARASAVRQELVNMHFAR